MNFDYTHFRNIEGVGARPVTMLPQTNLEKVEHPPGMSYEETYVWELAMLLEGKLACYEPLPTWSHDSVHYHLSKYLGWATRHSSAIQTSDIDNWISVESLLRDKRKNGDSFGSVSYHFA